MGESASMGDLACSHSIDVILTPTGRMALTQWRLRSNLSWATERSICKFEELFETHLRLKLPTSSLERVPLQSNLRLTDRLQSTDNFEVRRILMERNSIIKTADLLRMSTSNVQQVEREAWWINFQFSLDLWQFYFWDCRSSHHLLGMSGYLAEVNRGSGFLRCLLLSSWVLSGDTRSQQLLYGEAADDGWDTEVIYELPTSTLARLRSNLFLHPL